MEIVQTCTVTWQWCMSMIGARFAVFVNLGENLLSYCKAKSIVNDVYTLSYLDCESIHVEHVNDVFRGGTPRKSHKTRSRKAREKIIIDKGTFIVPKGSPACIKWDTTIDGC